MWLVAGAVVAMAARPLPSFREEVARAQYREIDALLERGCAYQRLLSGVVCAEGVTEAAIEAARAFRTHVLDDPGVAYLEGLAHRYAGRDPQAAAAWREAIRLDPTYDAAWYDLGELHLAAGRYDEAEHAFGRVAELVSEGDKAWVGPWRLAEVAAHRSDAAAFEAHIKRALARGFSFQQIKGLPNWKAFYADPALRDTLDKVLTVYATPDVRASLEE